MGIRSLLPFAFLIALAALWGLLLTVLVHQAVGACIGDCDADAQVTVDEIVTGVRIDLGTAPLSACYAMACNEAGSGPVYVDCLVLAMTNLFNGCPDPCREGCVSCPTDTCSEFPSGLIERDGMRVCVFAAVEMCWDDVDACLQGFCDANPHNCQPAPYCLVALP